MEALKAILLVNLGTPLSPRPKDVYRYLIEFLTDSRVLNYPWLLRQLLVRGIIVPKRFRASAKAYQQIWTEEGSPLMVYGKRVKEKLQLHLGDRYAVELAMRYQHPSIEEGLNTLLKKKPSELMIVPLFPQYASATVGSVHQKVMEVLKNYPIIPHVNFLSCYETHSAVIKAFQECAREYAHEEYDHVLFSFHGLPKKQLANEKHGNHCCSGASPCCISSDSHNRYCYSAQCYAMGQALREALNVPHGKCSLSFQSRLGKEPWLQPYTSDVIHHLAKQGKKRVLVFCPSFVCDCLETIFEISIEYQKEFQQAGGEKLVLVPGLNDHPAWIEALSALVKTS